MLYHLALCVFHQAVFLQLMLNQRYGQPGAVHRHVDLLQDIWKRTDMVLVSMGDHESLYLVDVLLQI